MSPSVGGRWDAKVWTVALLALRVCVLVLAIVRFQSRPVDDPDILRFQQVAEASGVPYRDAPVEYAPVEVAVIKIVAGADAGTTGIRIAVLAFACDVGTWLLIANAWGAKVGLRYLLLGAPLLLFIYLRLDLLPVLLTVAAVVAVRRRREATGGLLLAVATLAKIWPAALLPGWILARRRTATTSAVIVLLIGGIAWLSIGGLSGPRQVATFRGATGWGAESTVGTVVWIATDAPTRLERGAPRVGTIPGWAKVISVVVLAIGLGLVWWKAGRTGRAEDALPALAAVAMVIASSPVYSLQYAAWLIPWGAWAYEEPDGRPPFWLVAVTAALSGALFAVYGTTSTLSRQVLLLSRNGATVLIPIWWLVAGRGLNRLQGVRQDLRSV